MTKFEKRIERFKREGFEIEVEELGWCREATATKFVKTPSKDPWGNETSNEVYYREICYTITEYDENDVDVVREY